MKEIWGTRDGNFHTPEELPFFLDDSEKVYEENIENNLSLLEKNGWTHLEDILDDSIIGYRYNYDREDKENKDWVNLSYKINSHGFRGDEMPADPKKRSVICLGDSNTFGIGIPAGKTWTNCVGNTLGVRAYNLGIPNGNLDSAFRVLFYWLPKIRPAHVFMCTPPEGYEIMYESRTDDGTPINKLFPFLRLSEDSMVLHKEKVMRAMQSLCDQFNTPFTHDTCESNTYFSLFREHDLSRDLNHFGVNRHTYIAMHLLKKSGFVWDV